MRIHKISVLLCFLTISLHSQSWESVFQIGGEGKESITVLASGKHNSIFIGGIYEGTFDWEGEALATFGQDDLFLACLDSLEEWKWVLAAGSAFDDSWTQITVDTEGNLICVGTFWVDIEFGSIRLENETGGKSIFVLKVNPAGEVLWAKSFDGSALKEIRGVSTDEEGNIFLTGYFREELYFGDTILMARGETAVFITKLNRNGAPEWARQYGGRKDTRGVGVGVLPEGDLILIGYYNDTTYFDSFSLPANTFDRDIFIAGLNKEGFPQWARRAGGVFDEEPLDIRVDEHGEIWITGYLIGVLTLEEGFSIQSTNGTADFFLLRYAPDGSPIAAKAWGGTAPNQANGLDLYGNEVILAGIYEGNINLQGNIPFTNNGQAGFVGGFDKLGHSLWTRTIQASGPVFIHKVLILNNDIWIAGTFKGDAILGNQNLSGRGGFDGIFARLSSIPTGLDQHADPIQLEIFPNPAADTLFWKTTADVRQVRLENVEGEVVFQTKTVKHIDVRRLPVGVYFLHLDTGKEQVRKVILIQR